MIIFFGSSRKIKPIDIYENDVCGICKQPNKMQLHEVSSWFTLFFIPIFKITSEYFLVCPACKANRKIPKKEAKALIAEYKNGGAATQRNVRAEVKHQVQAPVAEAVAPTASVDNDAKVRAMIVEDIGAVLASIKNPDVLKDSSNFDKLYYSLNNGLSAKYGDKQLVDSVMKEYFQI